MPSDITGVNSHVSHTLNGGADKTSTEGNRQTSSQSNQVQAPPTNTVNITEAAKQLKVLETEVQKSTGVDSQRVEAIRSALESGNYPIDTDRVASKFIQIESALNR